MKSVFAIDNSTVADFSRSTITRHPSACRRLFGRALFASVSCALTVSSGLALAADTPQATIVYRPGDTVRVIVTFKEPLPLKSAMLRFGLQGGLPEGQKVFTSFFDANAFVKVSDRQFELTGKIAEHVASGTYQLSFINATDDADFSRNFTSGPDFPVITVCVRNDRRVDFPDIKSIRIGEQADSKP